MGFLLNRKVVTPCLLAMGLLAMIGGDIDGGAWIDALGLAYWVIAGWVGKFSVRRTSAKPTPQFTAQVTAMSARAQRSDGANGAFSRLDPEWQRWLRREVDTR